jgi:AraC-like DNA-binding protein
METLDAEEVAAQPGFHYVDFATGAAHTDRTFRRTPLLSVGEYQLSVDHPQFAAGVPETRPLLVFPRTSVRLISTNGDAAVCTPNTVNLFAAGDSCTREPVSDEGMRADWLALPAAVLGELARETGAEPAQRLRPVSTRLAVPIGGRTFLAQRFFFEAVHCNPTLSDLAVEEAALRLARRLLEEVASNPHAESRRFPTRRAVARVREIVEQTKSTLAREYWANFSVANLAAQVHCSPGYLSRTFSKQCGFTLHGYQQQLRLRASLQLLSEARFNGASIACQLGFANHSHFSDVFRTQFGITPTEFARNLSAASLRHLHEVLDTNAQHSRVTYAAEMIQPRRQWQLQTAAL